MSFGKLIGLGIVIHLVLLSAVFDIYFTSPILHGIEPVQNNVKPLAKRVVFISVDGLRLDALLENDANTNRPIAPYIRWIMSHRGAWSASHTHLPTESRPGHVAMLAGFYEDPSAVTKGWKENPVDFDSIFNRSSCSFSFGSPDIVNVFYKGLKHSCAYHWTYNETQDFSGNTMELDNWVLEKLKDFLSTKSSINSKPKSLFFLHLLGQDTSGHTHKPKTLRYRENLHNVDAIVREVDHLFANVFNDNETAFVLSADHGMTDWGSHGAGDPSETLTPLVVWGRGIKKAPGGPVYEEGIQQADITPLIAFLLGVTIPVNSVGTVPLKFLNYTRLESSNALLTNAKQMYAHYLAKKSDIESKLSLVPFQEFSKLSGEFVEKELAFISNEIKQEFIDRADDISRILIKFFLEGFEYYQKYFQRPLFLSTAASFVLWALLLLLSINETDKPHKSSKIRHLTLIPVALVSFILYKESFPLMYYAHMLLPLFLVWILGSYHISLPANTNYISLVTKTLFILLGVEMLVFSFFDRRYLILSLLFTLVWPVFERKTWRKTRLLTVWVLSGIGLGVFLLLPVVGRQPAIFRNVVAACLFIFASTAKAVDWIGYLLSLLVLVAGFDSYWVHTTFDLGTSQFYLQILSFALLAFIFPVLLKIRNGDNVFEKLDYTFVAISVPFLLLSVSHEGLFLFCLMVNLSCWIRLELFAKDLVSNGFIYESYSRQQLHLNNLTADDFRRAYFFLTYVFVAFFGIGNLATINSFDPAWVRCFITSFQPFVITGLILFKVVLPFLTVSLAQRVLTLFLNIPPYKVFILVLVYCNIMGINFLFLVKTEGSWLDIGTSLSHYVIQQVAIVFLLFLNVIAQFLIPARVGKTHLY